MAKQRVKLIMNPNADMGHAWKRASDLKHVAEAYGEISWAGTVFPTHAIDLARQAAEEGYDLVVAMGGDGTAHEVINGLMQVPAEKRPRFGIVPLGSGNDYAANLGLPKAPEDALKAVLTGKPHKVDLGMIEDEHGRREYFDNSVNIGFGGCVTIYSHQMPLLRGFLMYLVAVMQTIIVRYQVLDVKITADDEKFYEGKTLMMTLNNGPREGGGFITGPSAKLDDGIMDFAVTNKVSRLMMFRMIPEFMKGTQERFTKILFPGTCTRLKIESKQPLYLHADGEVFAGFAHNIHQLTAELLPDALEVMVPAD